MISRNVVFFKNHLPYASHGYIFPNLHNADDAHDTTHSPASTATPENSAPPFPATVPPSLGIDDLSPLFPEPFSFFPLAARVSQRIKKAPSYLADYHCNQAIISTPHSNSSKVVYPLSDFISYTGLSVSHKSFSLALSIESEPTSYAEAVQFACWRDAMKAEILALEVNKT